MNRERAMLAGQKFPKRPYLIQFLQLQKNTASNKISWDSNSEDMFSKNV